MMIDDDLDPALDPSLDHVSRRSFLERMGVSTFAAAVLGPEAMQGKTPDALNDKELAHEDVTLQSEGKRVEAFLCRPKSGAKRGSVIVIHEIFGLTDHIRDVACRFAKAGYDGLAVNFFTREGKPPEGFGPELMQFVGQIPDLQITADVEAAAKYLRGRADSNGKVGTVGFCWGGNVSMLAAAECDVNAAVAYYGRIKLPDNADRAKKPHSPFELAAKMKAPLLGHFGETDMNITKDVPAFREELKKHSKTAELYVYQGAGHAFNNDTRQSYNADAAKLAWRRTLEWFDKYLKA